MNHNLNFIHELINSNCSSKALVLFFQEHFKSLQINSQIDSITFDNYTSLPLVISRKVFSALLKENNGNTLKKEDFVNGMTMLYSKSYQRRIELIFSVIDYNKRGLIHKDDVKSFLLHFHLIMNKSKKEEELIRQVDIFYCEKSELSLDEMMEMTKIVSSDIVLLLIFFFHQYLPVNESCINYYYNEILGGEEDIEIKQEKEESFDYINPSKFFYDYLYENFGYYIHKSPLNHDDDDENAELDELLAFEDDLSEIKSNIPKYQSKSPSSLKSINYFLPPHKHVNVNHHLRKEKESIAIRHSLKHYKVKYDQLNPSPVNNPTINQRRNCSISCKSINNSFIQNTSLTGKCYIIHSDSKTDSTYAMIENMLFLTIIRTEEESRKETQMLSMKKLFLKSKSRSSHYNNHSITLISTLKGYIDTITLFFTQRAEAIDFTHLIETKINHRRLENEYDILTTLGSGFSGIVKLIKNKKDNVFYAVKIIPLNIKQIPTSIDDGDNDDDNLNLASNELDVCKLLMKVPYENIVKYYDYIESYDKIYIIMEYLNGLTLNSIINQKPIEFQRNKIQLTTQLIASLKILNYYGIIHRDLKPENIIVINNNGKYQAKIIDFGFSKVVCQSETLNEFLGTLSFVSPEIVLEKGYTTKIDLWSLGVILYIFLYEKLPFTHEGNGLTTIRSNIVNERIMHSERDYYNNDNDNNKIKETMLMCLEKNKERRKNINELCYLWNLFQ